MRQGRTNLITDIEGLMVGNADCKNLQSGVTVVTAKKPFTASVSALGGATGTRDIDLLRPEKLVSDVDALVLAGGSAFGLDAAGGVMAALREEGRGFPVGDVQVPIVPAAILFDLLNGGDKHWHDNPYYELGRKAYASSNQSFSLGNHGAGLGAMAGQVKGGLGSASIILDNSIASTEITVGALVAVNSFGTPMTPDGMHFWAAPWEMNAEFGGYGISQNNASLTMPPLKRMQNGSNTTIAILATNAPLCKAGCLRMAIAAHDGITRAIVPAHTPFDGDLVFALATGDTKKKITPEDEVIIGHAAATCLTRAIARGVYEARQSR